MSDRPLKVLSLGKDGSVFACSGARTEDTRQRHEYYAQRLRERAPGSEMRVVVYTHGECAPDFERVSPGLTLYGTRSRARAFFMFDLSRRLKAVLADGWRPDVITSQEPWEEGIVASSFARRLGARDVPQLHFDILSDAWLGESSINRLKRLLTRRVITRASHVRVVSEPLKRGLVERWHVDEKRISIAPVGVNFVPSSLTRDEARARLDPEIGESPVVLFVGRLAAAKNLSLWLKVARAVLHHVPRALFVLVGEGEERARLTALASELGIAGRVRFVGGRPHNELPDVYAAADLFLLTSHYEGFGRVVLEAMLASRPVVATMCGGTQDLVIDGRNGFLVPRDGAAALATRVVELLSDHVRARRFGVEGAAIARERFGLPVLTDRIIDVWQRA